MIVQYMHLVSPPSPLKDDYKLLYVNGLYEWSNNAGFNISPSKTVSLHICRKRNCTKMDPNLHLNNNPIICVEEYKFVGLTFDNSLTWKNHISNLILSCNKTLDLLKHITHKTWGADRVSLLRLYIMLIKPKLDYGCEAYSSACISLIESLNSIQNRAIRTDTGAFRSSPVLSLHAESGIIPLPTYRTIKTLNYFTRLLVNSNHSLYEAALLDNDDPRATKSPKSVLVRAKNLMEECTLELNNIFDEAPVRFPQWKIQGIHSCTQLYIIKNVKLRALFYEHYSSIIDP